MALRTPATTGTNHNKRFKATAEAHGLIIKKDAKYGWTKTSLLLETEAWLVATFGEEGLNVSRMPEAATGKVGKRKSKNRSIKYVCPCCGMSIRATKEVNVKCGDCDEEMVRA